MTKRDPLADIEKRRDELRGRLERAGDKRLQAKAQLAAASAELNALILEALEVAESYEVQEVGGKRERVRVSGWFPPMEIARFAQVDKGWMYRIRDEAAGNPRPKRTSKAKDADQ